MHIGLRDIDVAARPDDGHPDAGLAQRVALPPNGDRDATDIRERDIGQEGDVHERSLRV